MRVVVVLAVLAACGRIDFDPLATGTTGSPTWVGSLIEMQMAPPVMYPLQAIAAGDTVLLHVGCDGGGTATTAAATAPGWTFNQLGAVIGVPLKWGALFVATAPDTAPTTLSINWNINCGGIDALADELAHASVGAFHLAKGTGNCIDTIKTTAADDTIWAACSSGGTSIGPGPGFTMASDDNNTDESELEATSDPSGTTEQAELVVTGGGAFVMTTVALDPH